MADKVFRDFIPAGEDAGAMGKNFTDFVPPPTVEKKEEIKAEPVADVFKCDQCAFTTKYKLALVGHKRSHK